jgi:hypothetical protein
MLVNMNAHRITPLVAALTLAAVPAAFGASPPNGSHGQETDRAKVTQVSTFILCGSGAVTRTSRSVAVVVPRGSHGQETDQPTGTQFTLRLTCVNAHRSIVKATAPRGSHGQETDQPGARS